jgi:hypothetical protein
VQFHWNSENHIDEDLYKFCVELEYKLRPKITRFLISRLDRECCGDFSCFHFNVDLYARQITIADKTPAKYTRRILKDFDLEINRNFVQGYFKLYGPAKAV